ncbi:hypothetical protein TNCV_3543611 [Trichonephila clavipes]|nr:hypothetical protein TNCV_3543611 [Trichonephila clavipes]
MLKTPSLDCSGLSSPLRCQIFCMTRRRDWDRSVSQQLCELHHAPSVQAFAVRLMETFVKSSYFYSSSWSVESDLRVYVNNGLRVPTRPPFSLLSPSAPDPRPPRQSPLAESSPFSTPGRCLDGAPY